MTSFQENTTAPCVARGISAGEMQYTPIMVLICGACILSVQVYPLIINRSCRHPPGVLPPVSKRQAAAPTLEELLQSPHACEQVFLDVGSNIGNHVRFLFEPHLFPRADYPKLFAQNFRKPLTQTCAVGFEANAAHWGWLDQLAQAYNQKGWPTKFYHKAVSDTTGFVKFYRQGDEINNEWGFSAKDMHPSKRPAVLIPTVDLAEWMHTYLRPTQTVLMKMDIEGSEYAVLSHLLLKAGRILCSSVRLLTIEYHPHAAPDAFKDKTQYFHEFVNLFLQSSNTSCVTVVEEKDDESYWVNDFPLPQ
jgi:FkbM family methyltransferase